MGVNWNTSKNRRSNLKNVQRRTYVRYAMTTTARVDEKRLYFELANWRNMKIKCFIDYQIATANGALY